MMGPKGPPVKGAWGPIPGADALGTVEAKHFATAGGYQAPCYHSSHPPPGYSGTRGHGGAIFCCLCRAASPSMEQRIQRRQTVPGYWKQQTSTVYNSYRLSS